MPEKAITKNQADGVFAWLETQESKWSASVYPDHIQPSGVWTVNNEALAMVPRTDRMGIRYPIQVVCSEKHAEAIQRIGIVSFRSK